MFNILPIGIKIKSGTFQETENPKIRGIRGFPRRVGHFSELPHHMESRMSLHYPLDGAVMSHDHIFLQRRSRRLIVDSGTLAPACNSAESHCADHNTLEPRTLCQNCSNACRNVSITIAQNMSHVLRPGSSLIRVTPKSRCGASPHAQAELSMAREKVTGIVWGSFVFRTECCLSTIVVTTQSVELYLIHPVGFKRMSCRVFATGRSPVLSDGELTIFS